MRANIFDDVLVMVSQIKRFAASAGLDAAAIRIESLGMCSCFVVAFCTCSLLCADKLMCGTLVCVHCYVHSFDDV
jgi:hypothetical protein